MHRRPAVEFIPFYKRKSAVYVTKGDTLLLIVSSRPSSLSCRGVEIRIRASLALSMGHALAVSLREDEALRRGGPTEEEVRVRTEERGSC